MIKGKDLKIFIGLVISSFVLGIFLFPNYENYSDMITFLSIVIGFKITSLSIIFNSPLKKTLYDRRIKLYRTELHRLRDFYKFSIYVSCTNIVIILLVPNKSTLIFDDFSIGKSNLVLPVLVSSLYCLIKLCNELFHIFVYPTNE